MMAVSSSRLGVLGLLVSAARSSAISSSSQAMSCWMVWVSCSRRERR